MPLLTWKNDYSVQVEQIDEQHKRLVNLINQLYDALLEGKGKNSLAPILDELVDYTQTHFTTEEVMMKKCSYPKLEEHKTEHDTFTKTVKEFYARFQSGQAAISVELMEFLTSWLNNHILNVDKQYAPYLLK